MVTDFFATAAKDAGDALSIPVIDVFPNPCGMTTIAGPSHRGIQDIPHEWLCALLEAGFARFAHTLRKWERSMYAVPLPALSDPDLWPCETMIRPTIATTGLCIGFEYPFARSPLLRFVGPSPPRKFPALSSSPELDTWITKQELVVNLAFGTAYIASTKS
jgi:hypothetical protein